MNWFNIVLIVLLAIGVYGLWRGVDFLYFWGWYQRSLIRRGDDPARQERERIAIQAPAVIASLADSITLIVAVVLFFWLLR